MEFRETAEYGIALVRLPDMFVLGPTCPVNALIGR